ncbi:MAG: cytochrome c oxidase subunit 3 [Rhodomicrobiaceae bacterium]
MTERVELHEPYADATQQQEAIMMGMYVFLASEIMLFGGLVAVAFVLRFLHPQEMVEASKRLHIYVGAINTAVLLTSSLFVALAVQAARAAARSRTALFTGGAAGLGVAFLGLKAIEYYEEYGEGLLPGISEPGQFTSPVQRQFMDLYLVATGLHAIHVTIGILLLGGLGWLAGGGRLRLPQRAVTVETAGLYWHLVDVIWVFLYPILYLAR